MLVLSRKPGQKVLVGEIALTVLEVRGNRVKLGVEAPAATVVLRAELVVPEAEGPAALGTFPPAGAVE